MFVHRIRGKFILNQHTATLNAAPQESLRALQGAVAAHFDWRIMVGGKNEHPNFVIEKRVRYDLIRGWPMYTLYQIIGGFHKDPSGKTTLQYGVSGQGAVPLFHAAIIIIALLAITLLLGSFVFSPATNANWIAVLLMGVLLLSAVGYGVFAYRSYQGHLKELDRFMQEFAQGNF